MNIPAYHRQRKAMASAQADYDNECPEWPEEQEIIDDEEEEDLQ